MIESGRYPYVLFCCQQAVEKGVKAVIVHQTGQMPPRLHNLTGLAKRAGLEVDASRGELLRTLTNCYIQSRYPEEFAAVGGNTTQGEATQTLSRTKEILAWILGRIT